MVTDAFTLCLVVAAPGVRRSRCSETSKRALANGVGAPLGSRSTGQRSVNHVEAEPASRSETPGPSATARSAARGVYRCTVRPPRQAWRSAMGTGERARGVGLPLRGVA